MRSPASPSSSASAAIFEMIDVHAHDHRHAARPRENGDMARGTASAQYQAAVAPIGGEKHRRRHVVGRDDDARRHGLIGFTGQMPQHAIAQVAQDRMRGPGNRDRRPPRRRRFPDRSPRSTPGWRPRRRRSAQRPAPARLSSSSSAIWKERMASASASPASPREHGEIRLRRRKRIDKGLMLLRRGPMLTGIVLRGSQTHERPKRDPGGGGPPLDAMRRSMRPIVHPENLRRPASPALPARPSHRSPRRENKSSNPSAPWSP